MIIDDLFLLMIYLSIQIFCFFTLITIFLYEFSVIIIFHVVKLLHFGERIENLVNSGGFNVFYAFMNTRQVQGFRAVLVENLNLAT